MAEVEIQRDRGIERGANRSAHRSGDMMRIILPANRYLQTKPDDQQVSEQATEALLKATVPAWLDFMLAGEFSEAVRALAMSFRTP